MGAALVDPIPLGWKASNVEPVGNSDLQGHGGCVRMRNAEAMRHFCVGTLGLKQHPQKDNWPGWEGSFYPVRLSSLRGSKLWRDIIKSSP